MKLLIYFLLLVALVSIDIYAAEGLEVEVFQVISADPESLQSIVRQLLTENGKVSYDARTNSIIVIDTRKNINKIAAVIEKVDARPKQVRIEVIITDLAESFAQQIGLTGPRVRLPGGAEAIVGLIEKREDSSIRSKSSVTTLSNNPARFQVTSDVMLGAELIVYSGESFVVIPAREPIGNILEVLPRVNNNDTITLYIQPTLTTLEQCANIPFKRTLATQVVVNSGETIVLGGLDTRKTMRSQTSAAGTPDRGSSIEKSGKIVIFLTATILE